MAVRQSSVALGEAEAEHAADRAIVIERGMAGVAEWEVQRGELSAEELAWADSVLDRSTAPHTVS